MATTLPHIQTHHLPQPYSTTYRPLPPTNLVPNSSYHVLKAAIKKAIPHSKSSSSSSTKSTSYSSSSSSTTFNNTTNNTTTKALPIPRRTRPTIETHHPRPRSLSFHSPISTSSFSSSHHDDEIVIEMIEDEEAVGDDDEEEVNVVSFGDRRKIERLERARRLLECYGCRGC